MTTTVAVATCPCGADDTAAVFTYSAPPPGEIAFRFAAGTSYRREVVRCRRCGHFLSRHDMDDTALYLGDYVSATYGDGGIRQTFARITGLPPEKSDNAGRVRRILEFAAASLTAPARERRPPRVLDVGSGLGVFLHRMKAAGWRGAGVDRDPRLIAHLRETVGVDGVCGDFEGLDLGRFDLVTFNKVLEHVKDPRAMLAAAAGHLHDEGAVYVEVPDGETAVHEGSGREEFFIDHHHVFSLASLALLAVAAGFSVRAIERVREPSTKFTLRAFLVPGTRTDWSSPA